MLEERGIEYSYREYRKEPLSRTEIRSVLEKLGMQPKEVLRLRDPAAKQLGLTGSEPANRLVDLMVEYPTLLQRPIGVSGNEARVGRPVERLLELI